VESHHRRLDLIAARKVTVAMHKAVITKLNRSVPEFISGHSPDGSPTEIPHLAYLPLPFLGTKYAKGHIMGVAVAVPKELDRGQRRLALATVGQVQELTMGPLGRWKLELDDLGKFNLRPDVWTGGTDGATKWATVTPIALDRHPKARDRNERESELIGIIEEGCRRIGLDTPVQVIITAISPHFGTSAAHDFPPMRRKDGSLRRHVHAILIFDRPVRGPIVLGAGRYRGYGFCRPLLASEVF